MRKFAGYQPNPRHRHGDHRAERLAVPKRNTMSCPEAKPFAVDKQPINLARSDPLYSDSQRLTFQNEHIHRQAHAFSLPFLSKGKTFHPQPLAAYRPGVLFPLVRFCGYGLERGSAQDPPPQDPYRGSYRDSESPRAEGVLF